MPAKAGSRFPRIFYSAFVLVNGILLGANILILCVLVYAFNRFLPPDRSAPQAAEDAARLGMDVCFIKEPLALFVNKCFPRKTTFKIIDNSQQVAMFTEDVDPHDHGGATRRAEILLGLDFVLSCYYSRGTEIRVHELQLIKKNDAFVDLNADGFYDVRFDVRSGPLHSAEREAPQVWYKDKWRETIWEDGERFKYEKQLIDGERVEFDMQDGRWHSLVTDEPSR